MTHSGNEKLIIENPETRDTYRFIYFYEKNKK